MMVTVLSAFNNFIFHKRLQGLADASIKSYRDILAGFLQYVGDDVELSGLTIERVNAYIMSLYDRKLSKATISTYIRNLRIFLMWCDNEYDLTFKPYKIIVPKSPKKKVNLLSGDDIMELFNSVKTSIPWISARNKAIIALMLDSGLRQSEVCGLLYGNINFSDMVIKVTGKGAKDRYVPLGVVCKALIDDYTSLCPFNTSGCLFLGRSGRQITNNAIKVFMNRVKHLTGFDLTSHKLRHNFATNFCIDNIRECGKSNVYDLSIILGHESIETTKLYEHFAHEIVASENSISHLDRIYKV